MSKFNNRNTRTRCEIRSKLIIKTPEWCHWHWTYFKACVLSIVSIVNFQQVNADWWISIRLLEAAQHVTRAKVNGFACYTGRYIEALEGRYVKISQNSQENTSFRVSLLTKLQASGAVFFLWNLLHFWEHLFYRTPLDDCFWLYRALLHALHTIPGIRLNFKFNFHEWSKKDHTSVRSQSRFDMIWQILELSF